MEAARSARLRQAPYFIAGAVALLDAFSLVLISELGFGARWWTLVHWPMSELLLGLAIGEGVSAHDPLRWNDFAYFSLNVGYLAATLLLLLLLVRRFWRLDNDH